MIIVQSNKERTLPHHFDCSTAMYGAIETAQKYRLTSFEEIQSGKLVDLLSRNLCVGSVEFMHEVFAQLGINVPKLPRNSNRKAENITLANALKRTSSGEKLFIKPVQTKLFTGFVLDRSVYTCIKDLPNDTQLLAYSPFRTNIATEWRAYILNGKINDMKNYSGDFTVMPSINYIESILRENIDFPSSYTIDVGVLDNGENVVIEFNDMYAIGNYGVRNDIYVSMLRDRFFEIIRRKNHDT